MSKCPKCERTLTHVNLKSIKAHAIKVYESCAFTCPYCHTAISFAIDHVAFRNEIVANVIAGLSSKK